MYQQAFWMELLPSHPFYILSLCNLKSSWIILSPLEMILHIQNKWICYGEENSWRHLPGEKNLFGFWAVVNLSWDGDQRLHWHLNHFKQSRQSKQSMIFIKEKMQKSASVSDACLVVSEYLMHLWWCLMRLMHVWLCLGQVWWRLIHFWWCLVMSVGVWYTSGVVW